MEIKTDEAEIHNEDEWINVIEEGVSGVDEIDFVIVWASQARLHYDAGEYDYEEIVQKVERNIEEKTGVDVEASKIPFEAGFSNQQEHHKHTKEIRISNPFRED